MTRKDAAIVSLTLKAAAQHKHWTVADFDEHGFRYPARDGILLLFHKEETIWNVTFEDRWGYERLANELAAQAAQIHERLWASRKSHRSG
jgi:hypothetical protein